MPIPGFQELMLPVLRLTRDGQEHRLRDLVDQTADLLGLTEEERLEMLPSGQNRVIRNRTTWAKQYLLNSGLLESTRRGYVRITEAGRALLADPPEAITIAYLKTNYPQIKAFLSGAGGNDTGGSDGGPAAGRGTGDGPGPLDAPTVTQTPEEALEVAYLQLRADLAQELLSHVKELHPSQFERLVVELLVKMGYGGTLKDAGRAVGKSGDGGIDGIIKEDRLGLDVIYVQAKRYVDHPVSRPDIQAFVGALHGVRARKGVFITTSRFAQPAREYAASIESKVVLIDGEQLADYMIDFNLGVTTVNTFEVKRLDSDYFEEG